MVGLFPFEAWCVVKVVNHPPFVNMGRGGGGLWGKGKYFHPLAKSIDFNFALVE